MDLFSKAFPLVSDKATTVDRYGVSVLRFVANAFPEVTNPPAEPGAFIM